NSSVAGMRPSCALPTRLPEKGYGPGDTAHALAAEHLRGALLRPVPGRMDPAQETPAMGGHAKLPGASAICRCGFQPAPCPHPVHVSAQRGLLHVERASHRAGAGPSHLRHRDEHTHLADPEAVGPERFVVDGSHGAVEEADLVRNALPG